MRSISLFASFTFLWLTPLGVADEADSDKLAREAYLRFCEAFNKKDLDGIMKVIDVPWVASGKPVIKDRAELGKIWKELLAKPSSGISLPLIKKVKIEPLSVLRDAAKDDKEFLKKFEELRLTKDDRAVDEALTIFIVRVRNGDAKIVGHYDVGLRIPNGKLFP
jgi:hypothetical protein